MAIRGAPNVRPDSEALIEVCVAMGCHLNEDRWTTNYHAMLKLMSMCVVLFLKVSQFWGLISDPKDRKFTSFS